MKKIKQLMHSFGILVIRVIWPSKGNRNLQKMGVLILGLSALIGVTQANSIQKWLAGSAGAALVNTPKLATQPSVPAAPVTAAESAVDTVGGTTIGGSATEGAPNIVDLVGDSEIILKGMVKEVTDGFENGVPYTQVTLQVDEALRGQVGSEYTFRQFGLKEPRKLENGKTYLGVTPEGWSKYKEGENAVLFLYKAASMTGLRTTVGLGQGKVVFENGNATSQSGNEGLFENVDVDAKLLNDKDKRLLATKKGAVNADGFLSFVRRAVNGKWVEGGKLRHVKK